MNSPFLRFARLAAVCVLMLPGVLAAQSYLITTAAGGALPPTGQPGLSVPINSPNSLASDAFGNLYLIFQNCVFKLDKSGILTRVAGSQGRTSGGDGGPATSAGLNGPRGVAVDTKGNLYIADYMNFSVRKVSVDGTISTVAGTGMYGDSGDGVPAIASLLGYVTHVAVDATGYVYFDDGASTHRIRKLAPDGSIGTVLESGLFGTWTVDPKGAVYFYGASRTVQKIGTDGATTTVAGNGTFGSSGDGGPATSVGFGNVSDLVADANGNVFIAEGESVGDSLTVGFSRVHKVAPDGGIVTVAGNGSPGVSGDGGPAASAAIGLVAAIATDAEGSLFIEDSELGEIRKVALDGTITTIAGNGTGPFHGDEGPALQAGLSSPESIAVDVNGNVYTADEYNQRVRKISPDGTISTVAGNGTQGFSGDGGPAIDAEINFPGAVAVDTAGNLYFAQDANQRIRRVATDGTITTIAGTGVGGVSGDGGPAVNAQLNYPHSIVLDSKGNLYVSDDIDSRVRKVAVDGTITTLAGGRGGQLAVDGGNNLYIGDNQNHVVRKVAVDGTVTTVAGNGGVGFSGDGLPATSASLGYISGLTVDASGGIFIAEGGGSRIRKVGADGTISTVAGTGSQSYSGDGGPAANAAIGGIAGISSGRGGAIYLADSLNNVVRVLIPEGKSAFWSLSLTHNGNLYLRETGATYSAIVTNAPTAGLTNGQVTASFTLPAGLTLVSASGAGWTCTSVCTRGDILSAGSSYPPITLTVNVSSTAFSQETVSASISGGGSPLVSASDLALVYDSSSPVAPILTLPADGTGQIQGTPTLTWTGSTNTYYDVYLGATSNPPLAASVGGPAYNPGTLTHNTIYYWKVVARNATGSAESGVSLFGTDLKFQTITFPGFPSHTYGDAPFALTASSGSGLPVTFSAAGSCGAAGSTVTITGAGSCTITASQSGNNVYFPAVPVSRVFTIAKAAATVSLRNFNQTYTGTALPVTVSTKPSGLSVDVTYNGAAATPSEPGAYLVVATVDDQNYQGAATGTLVIAKQSPVVSWKPAPVEEGTPLGGAQLNATTTIPGAFVYSPSAGTLLSAGLHNLSLTFTPSDSVHYTTVTQDILVQVQAPVLTLVALVNSASFAKSTVAPGEIVTAFGTNLSNAGISIQDAAGQMLPLQVLFASPQQANLLIPASAQPGTGTLTAAAGGQTATLAIQIGVATPGLFSADASGTGPATGSALHVAADGTTIYTPLAACAGTPLVCGATPIQFGSADERIFLVLYGTGIRGSSSTANATVTIGGVTATAIYAGPQGQYAGLDQINVEMPRSLVGSGPVTVQVIVNGVTANVLEILMR